MAQKRDHDGLEGPWRPEAVERFLGLPESPAASSAGPTTRQRSAMASQPVQLTLTRERETKNTVRYQAHDEEAAVGTLYVRKDAVDAMGAPDAVTITVAPAEVTDDADGS